MIQDISLFYEKCSSICGSNDCPTEPYYKHPTQSICVSDCPDGYTESGAGCAKDAYCHSTCSSCSIKNDPTKCSTCISSYLLFATPAPVIGS